MNVSLPVINEEAKLIQVPTYRASGLGDCLNSDSLNV